MEIVERDSPRYEPERRSLLWNRRAPKLYPDRIVRARSARDVVETVRLAGHEGSRIASRSGGHSWWGAPVRDGGTLVDLAGLDAIELDDARQRAWVGPGVRTERLVRRLERSGLAFPAGHCPTVGLGGYLLAGGMGWNPGAWGPACHSVEEVELVTADGVVSRASPRERPELLWAARGAGVGFPGIVTRFGLRLQELPSTIAQSTDVYPLAAASAVSPWWAESTAELAPEVEPTLVVGRSGGEGEPSLIVTTTAFAGSWASARRLLAPLEGSPARPEHRDVCRQTSFANLYEGAVETYPRRHRYAADQWWTDDDPAAVLAHIEDAASELPSRLSHILLTRPRPASDPAAPGSCFSAGARTFVACYAVWDDPGADAANLGWLERVRARLLPLSAGGYVGEADLGTAPERSRACFKPESWDRLQRLVREIDPEGRFHGFPES